MKYVYLKYFLVRKLDDLKVAVRVKKLEEMTYINI